MDARFNKPWIPADRIEELIQLEPALIILAMSLATWLFYKIFLKDVSSERHTSIRTKCLGIFIYSAIFTLLLGAYYVFHAIEAPAPVLERLLPYLGLTVVILGAMVLVKSASTLLLQYLFFRSKQVGVPIVVVNTFTLVLYALIFGWLSKSIFSLQVAPLLATSAIFSILLGLALQDTLGNLFSGIALQMDKAFDIGNWVEVTANNQKWIGRVLEISWRATTMVGLADEIISIPNRVISQGLVANFSIQHKPTLRKLIFRVPYGTSIDRAKQCLVRAAYAVPKILKYPEPWAWVDEGTENWIPIKLLYFVEDYGHQWEALDQVVAKALEQFSQAGIQVAPPRLRIEQDLPENPLPHPTRTNPAA